jgi:hypothetical protein
MMHSNAFFLTTRSQLAYGLIVACALLLASGSVLRAAGITET